MEFKPHSYQQRGIDQILRLKKSALFLPMGSGKTATTLKALQELKDKGQLGRCLIIGPKRVIESTWPDEIDKWENIDLSYSSVTGTPTKRIKALQEEADVYLISKDNLLWLVESKLFDFDTVVVDELSCFKSTSAKKWRALKAQKYQRFIGLTGTPAPKSYIDLWAQVYLIDRGKRLGKTLTKFRQEFCEGKWFSFSPVPIYEFRPDKKKDLEKSIEDICMSISMEEYATLPDVTYLNYPVTVPMEKYRKFKQEMVLNEEVSAANAGVLCNKLLQYTSGSIYTDDREIQLLHNHKIEALKDLIESANGQSVLILYNYRHESERIKKALKDYRVMDVKQKGAIEKWKQGLLDVLMLQPQSAGHGLNLQEGGHIAVWFTLPWSLELYQQANARLARQGQKEKVTIYHLIAKKTIDEQVLRCLEDKDTTQARLLEVLRK